MKIENLFPTPIGFFKYRSMFSDKEKNFLLNQKTRPNHGNRSSLSDSVLENRAIKNIRKFVDESLHKYFKTTYAPNRKVKPYITQSWLNYTKENEFHHKHSHPNSFLSGIFYVQADAEKDKVYFHRERLSQFILSTDSYNIYNSSSWWFEVETKDLIIFPSSLIHEVSTVVGQERISLSFNTFFQGVLGVNQDFTELSLKR